MAVTWWNASINGISARAIIAFPSGFANALAALASAVIGSGTRQSVVVVARKVVALAKLAADNLQRQK